MLPSRRMKTPTRGRAARHTLFMFVIHFSCPIRCTGERVSESSTMERIVRLQRVQTELGDELRV